LIFVGSVGFGLGLIELIIRVFVIFVFTVFILLIAVGFVFLILRGFVFLILRGFVILIAIGSLIIFIFRLILSFVLVVIIFLVILIFKIIFIISFSFIEHLENSGSELIFIQVPILIGVNLIEFSLNLILVHVNVFREFSDHGGEFLEV